MYATVLYNARYTILCDQATDLYRLYNYTLYVGQCVKLTFVPGGGWLENWRTQVLKCVVFN